MCRLDYFEEFPQDASRERCFLHRQIAIRNATRDSGKRWREIGCAVYRREVFKRDRTTFARWRNAIDNPLSRCNVADTSAAKIDSISMVDSSCRWESAGGSH
jgi:hypothetical protein